MSIQDWGAIGELVGAVAVIATLFYLARQIQQNTREARSANYHRVTDSFNAINVSIAHDPELARIFRDGAEDYAGLSDVEKTQYGFIMHAAFRVMDVIHFESHHGTADRSLWEYEKKTIDSLLRGPGSRAWWRERPFNFSEEFVDYVEREVLTRYAD